MQKSVEKNVLNRRVLETSGQSNETCTLEIVSKVNYGRESLSSTNSSERAHTFTPSNVTRCIVAHCRCRRHPSFYWDLNLLRWRRPRPIRWCSRILSCPNAFDAIDGQFNFARNHRTHSSAISFFWSYSWHCKLQGLEVWRFNGGRARMLSLCCCARCVFRSSFKFFVMPSRRKLGTQFNSESEINE